MHRRNWNGTPLVGGSSLLVIFSVLCLTVFALLGLSTVQADQRLSQASKDAVTAYYQADTQAEAVLAQLRNGQIPPGVDVADGAYTYECPISEHQQLQVEVQCDAGQWKILRWQAVSTVTWEDNAPLDLWDGGSIVF